MRLRLCDLGAVPLFKSIETTAIPVVSSHGPGLGVVVYDKDDIRCQWLYEFNVMVANDDRVEQTVLTVHN